jgi:hypothetical protein
VVGCAVAASIQGVVLPGAGQAPATQAKPRIKLSEMRRR